MWQLVDLLEMQPMLFGMVYSSTVAGMPKAIFMVAAGGLSMALALLMLVRNPVSKETRGLKGRGRGRTNEVGRGRSRASKDLRGGAAGYESE
jgi:hypothetical protein